MIRARHSTVVHWNGLEDERRGGEKSSSLPPDRRRTGALSVQPYTRIVHDLMPSTNKSSEEYKFCISQK